MYEIRLEVKGEQETQYSCTDENRFRREIVKWASVSNASFWLNGKPWRIAA